MKLCPNPDCPYLAKRRAPAEYLDRATTCSDCACPLVDANALGSAETERILAEWEAEREPPSEGAPRVADARRIDLVTGTVLVAGSVLLFVVSSAASASMGGSGFVLAFGPFGYGVYRLLRAGSGPRKEKKKRADGPYR